MPLYNAGSAFSRLGSAAIAAGLIGLGAAPAHGQTFNVTNLVSDGSVPAVTIDPSLINPWGIASSPTGPFWVSDNNSGVSTLYNGAGAKLGLTVTIAPPAGGSGATPTGQVFSGSATDFKVSGGGKTAPARFIFDTEDGTISGWAPSVNGTNSILAVDNSASGAVYKGLAIGATGGANFLYAANFNSGQVEVYDGGFSLVKSFTDPGVAAGYAPFNVANLGGTLFVSFALQNGANHDDVAGPGNGYVDAFDLNGNFLRRVVSLGGQVNSPWGLDLAPSSFGSLAGDLLVGNFGDGTISAFNPTTGVFQGQLLDSKGKVIVLNDLWALVNGNGGAGGSTNAVYFTTGVLGEAHGLFGAISAVPEPASWAFMLLGVSLLGLRMRSRRPAHHTRIA